MHDEAGPLKATQQPLQLVERKIQPARFVKIGVSSLRGLERFPQAEIVYVKKPWHTLELAIEKVEQTQNLVMKGKGERDDIEQGDQAFDNGTTNRRIEQHIRPGMLQQTTDADEYIIRVHIVIGGDRRSLARFERVAAIHADD